MTDVKTIENCKLKAEQGDSEAQNFYGCCYCSGDGVEQSYEKAVYWFAKSAEQGNSRAKDILEHIF